MRLAVGFCVALGDRHVEIRAHLVDETDRLTGELAAGAGQRAQMRGDEVGAGGIEGRRNLAEQFIGTPRQVRRTRLWLVVDRAAQARVTGERVDVAGLDPVEAQTQ